MILTLDRVAGAVVRVVRDDIAPGCPSPRYISPLQAFRVLTPLLYRWGCDKGRDMGLKGSKARRGGSQTEIAFDGDAASRVVEARHAISGGRGACVASLGATHMSRVAGTLNEPPVPKQRREDGRRRSSSACTRRTSTALGLVARRHRRGRHVARRRASRRRHARRRSSRTRCETDPAAAVTWKNAGRRRTGVSTSATSRRRRGTRPRPPRESARSTSWRGATRRHEHLRPRRSPHPSGIDRPASDDDVPEPDPMGGHRVERPQ